MSNKERDTGGITTDFTKFSESHLKKIAQTLGKNQGTFLLHQSLINHHKDTFGSNYMDHTKCGYDNETELVETHEQCDLVYFIKDNRQFIMFLHDVVYPKGSKFTKTFTSLPSSKV